MTVSHSEGIRNFKSRSSAIPRAMLHRFLVERLKNNNNIIELLKILRLRILYFSLSGDILHSKLTRIKDNQSQRPIHLPVDLKMQRNENCLRMLRNRLHTLFIRVFIQHGRLHGRKEAMARVSVTRRKETSMRMRKRINLWMKRANAYIYA